MSFQPILGLSSPLLQTVLGAKIPSFLPNPPANTYCIALKDGDRLALEVSTPNDWQPDNHTVVMLHGLGGSHSASYLVRLTHKLLRNKIKVVRVNFRGCGSGRGLAKGIYHAGCSDDIITAIHELNQSFPISPITLIGFSLGGNVALKMVGELKETARQYLHKVIAVSPPIDLARCADMIAESRNHLFRRYYIKRLSKTINLRHQLFPELGPAPVFTTTHGFWEFDNLYTCRYGGFSNASEYYQKSSALPLIKQISIPCKILFAADDPFVDCSSIQNTPLPQHIEITVTKNGGHMGFLAMPWSKGGIRWMDYQIIEWLKA